jgi:hypothetical protein
LGRHAISDHGIEVRCMDPAGHLHEEHLHGGESYISMGMLVPTLVTIASLIENEMKALNQQVQALAIRIKTIEKQIRLREGPAEHKTSKSTKNQSEKRNSRKISNKRIGSEN